MYIKRAHKTDLPQIVDLVMESKKFVILPEMLNKHDLAYCAKEESGELIGFIWCGLTSKGSRGYIEYCCVASKHQHKGIAVEMLKHLIKDCTSRKVKYLSAVTIQDQYHDKVLMTVLKSGIKARATPATGLLWELN